MHMCSMSVAFVYNYKQTQRSTQTLVCLQMHHPNIPTHIINPTVFSLSVLFIQTFHINY